MLYILREIFKISVQWFCVYNYAILKNWIKNFHKKLGDTVKNNNNNKKNRDQWKEKGSS